MFKNKKIEALEDKIKTLLRESIIALERIGKIETSSLFEERAIKELFYWKNSLIPCSTCKCLIRKEDAVKGKSEVRKGLWNGLKTEILNKDYENIFTPYFCLRCKPKKLK